MPNVSPRGHSITSTKTASSASRADSKPLPARLGDFAEDTQQAFCQAFCRTPQISCEPDLIFDLLRLGRGELVVLGYAPSMEAFEARRKAS